MHRTLFNPEGISPTREQTASNSEADSSHAEEDREASASTVHEEVDRLLSDLGLHREQTPGADSRGEEFEVTAVTEDDFSIKIPITLKIPSPLVTFLRRVENRRGSATVVCTSSDDAQEDVEVTIESTEVVDAEHGTEQGRVILLCLGDDGAAG